MDHTYVEENQIADRYVMGTLPAEEAERFENHYLSCPECLDRLELAESVERGFKRMAGQDAAALVTVRQLAAVAWLARLGRMRQLGVLLSALLVFAVIPSGLWLNGPSQLAQAHSKLNEERQRSVDAGALQAELGRRRASREARTRAEGKLAQALLPVPTTWSPSSASSVASPAAAARPCARPNGAAGSSSRRRSILPSSRPIGPSCGTARTR